MSREFTHNQGAEAFEDLSDASAAKMPQAPPESKAEHVPRRGRDRFPGTKSTPPKPKSDVALEDKKAIDAEIRRLKKTMDEDEKNRTTYGIARVKTKDGKTEMWISGSGHKTYIRPDIRGNNVGVKNKHPEADQENRFNGAEQCLMREAEAQDAQIVALGATRPVCPACQKVAAQKGLTSKIVTPLK